MACAQDLRNPPGKILDLSSSSGHLSKLLTALESTKEIRMMDMSGTPVFHSSFFFRRANLWRREIPVAGSRFSV